MPRLQVWVDADSCPAPLREFISGEAARRDFLANFVANRKIVEDSENVKMVVCGSGKDAADDFILENSKENDIVVTRDVLFASRLVERGIPAMNDRGFLFSKSNIEDKLLERKMSLALSGIRTEKNRKNQYGKRELEKFEREFSQEMQRLSIAKTYSTDLFGNRTGDA